MGRPPIRHVFRGQYCYNLKKHKYIRSSTILRTAKPAVSSQRRSAFTPTALTLHVYVAVRTEQISYRRLPCRLFRLGRRIWEDIHSLPQTRVRALATRADGGLHCHGQKRMHSRHWRRHQCSLYPSTPFRMKRARRRFTELLCCEVAPVLEDVVLLCVARAREQSDWVYEDIYR